MDKANVQIIVQSLEKQLADRLEKLWRIFSWSSSIFLSLIAGLIVLRKWQGKTLEWHEQGIISFAILVIAFYAWQWIDENLRFERKIRDQLDVLFEQHISYSGLKALRPDRARFGYKMVIILLALAALVTTWMEFSVAVKPA